MSITLFPRAETAITARVPFALLALAFTGILIPLPVRAAIPATDLASLSLEQLSNIRVTTVSKHAEKWLDAPASVYVITREDILRSGVTSIPEALRLAPGVEVMRSGSHGWTISIRGFNNDLANKLLVLIDGRSVYSPLYAGVFWDVQDLLLQDIDRIEVISGPGGTLWGANAVNGVINIITRSAEQTQGGYAEAGGGKEEHGFAAVRYGAKLSDNTFLRGYVKYFDRAAAMQSDGSSAHDDWRMQRGGFRLDREGSRNDTHFTLEGDVYRGKEGGIFRDTFTLGTLPGPSFTDDMTVAGGNLLGRWNQKYADNSDLRLQFYYDHTERDIINTYNEARDTYDWDGQYHFHWGQRQDIVWGAGFRFTRDRLDNSSFAAFLPDHRADRTYSTFLQDKVDLWRRRVFLTLGSKFEHNDYTGFESQPNVRLSWLISARQTVWAAVSRAVRIPSRLDADLHLTVPYSIPGLPFPAYVKVNGSHDFVSEKLLAYEAGWRMQVTDDLSLDVATFYNRYDKLQTTEPLTPQVVVNPPSIYVILPNVLANGARGESYGGTISTQWQLLPTWRLQMQYAFFDLQLHNKHGSLDRSTDTLEGDSPKNQFSLFSYLDLPYHLSLYTGVRYVDHLSAMNVPGYLALDLSLRYQLTNDLALSVTGENLTDPSHPEYGSNGPVEIARSIYGKVTYHF